MISIGPLSGDFKVYPCTSAVQVGQFVYLNGNTAEPANVTLEPKHRVIGVCIEKQTSTQCTVQMSGVVRVFSGLSAGQGYLVSPTGQPFTGPVTTPGWWAVQAGIGLSANELLLQTKTAVRIS